MIVVGLVFGISATAPRDWSALSHRRHMAGRGLMIVPHEICVQCNYAQSTFRLLNRVVATYERETELVPYLK